MKIRILGAHMFESESTRLSSIIIDDVMAIDAGGLTSGLSFEEQARIRWICLTHGHYDHIRDVPAIALKEQHRTIDVYATRPTLDILNAHFINGTVYPRFTEYPSPEKPALRLNPVEPLEAVFIGEYRVLAVPVPHAIPSVGYEITHSQGSRIFISGDTGPGLASCWEQIAPQMIIIDMAFSNKSADIAPKPGHLCPSLLARELEQFGEIRGYLPRVILTHLNPAVEEELEAEARAVAADLGAEIVLAHEDMVIKL